MRENIYAIHGLERKRGELAGQILTLERQLLTLRQDMAALDRSLCLLDPTIKTTHIKPIRPRQRFRYFKSGELSRLLLDTLRKAKEPTLNHALVEAVMRTKELDTQHRDTPLAVEKRVLAAMHRFGLQHGNRKDQGRMGRTGPGLSQGGTQEGRGRLCRTRQAAQETRFQGQNRGVHNRQTRAGDVSATFLLASLAALEADGVRLGDV